MSEVQYFFHKALAVIFAKLQYLKKAFGKLYRVIPLSSCTCNVCRSYTRFNSVPYKLPLNKNVNVNVLRLYCTDLYDKYLRKDQSMGQTVV